MGRNQWTRRLLLLALGAFALVSLALPDSFLEEARAADEFSSGDKLRTLYSNHFSFTDSGFPQVTIEIMGGQKKVHLFSHDGLVALPDGEGGASLSGADEWTLTVEDSKPAKVREWSVVERLSAEDALDAEVAIARWKKRGHRATSFEIGTIFAVDGEVLDTREILIAIDPTRQGHGKAKAKALSSKYGVEATIYSELVRRPSGTVVAKSGNVELRNPSVLWFQNAKFKSARGGTIGVRDVETGRGGSQLKTSRQDRSYFGLIYVTVGGDGKLSVVNAVASDDLLSGLVPSEMFPVAPTEALKAQSIAARTELLSMLGTRHLGDPFLLCATQHCQVYSGAGHEHPRTTKAVRTTRGQVMVHSDRLIDARYSATCGGHTEHNEVVWGGAPQAHLRGHSDGSKVKGPVTESKLTSFLSDDGAFCAKTKYSKTRYRWTVTADAGTLSNRLGERYPGFGQLQKLEPLRRGVSGRIYELRVVGSDQTHIVEGELTIRRLLGGLRSSLFTVESKGPETSPTTFVFTGGGFGHGVGMCQLGAIGMAESGRDVEAILKHYYRGVSIHRLY